MVSDFGSLLRRARVEAEHSQESLAELAGISAVAISGYERGLRATPRRETVEALATALQLNGPPRAAFEEAASRKRGSTTTSSPERTHNLPWQATSFIGRIREIEDISGMLATRRVVTITGAGGIGKTRTALEVASRLAPFPHDGVWFVDLAPLADGTLVVNNIASTLDIQISSSGDATENLVSAIKDRDALLILDNCEHVICSVREIASAILQSCPKISMLATSRERLGVVGEKTYRLSTMSVPNKAELPTGQGGAYDAIDLLADRAADAQYTLAVNSEHAAAAADICRRLDGNALAIELAAARLPVLGIVELQAQLARHFRVISGGHHLPARQQTLHATIAWSHDLLDDAERTLFRRLAVFARGWTLDAAEDVCASEPLEKAAVLDLLFSLTEKSLVVVDLDAATPRYSFFESTRAFALERLSASGESEYASRRHAQWMAAFADRTYDRLINEPRGRWESIVLPELDNTLGAIEWALGDAGDVVLAGRIVSGFQGIWIHAGLASVGQRYVNASLDGVEATEHPALAARLLVARSLFLYGTARVEAQRTVIAMLDRVADARMLARCYSLLAYALAQTGEYDAAVNASSEAWDLMHEQGLTRSVLYLGLLGTRSRLFRRQGRFDEAKANASEALHLARALKDEPSIPSYLAVLADIEFVAGDVRRAVALVNEALASDHHIGGYYEVYSRCNLACYQLVLGDVDAAESSARQALHLARDTNDFIVHTSIQHLATVAALRGEAERAAMLLGYVDPWYESIGYHRDPTDKRGYDLLMGSLRQHIAAERLPVLAARGAKLSRDAAIDEALAPPLSV